jgi:hypothetical protein
MGLVAITHAITNANAKPSSFTTSSVWNLGLLSCGDCGDCSNVISFNSFYMFVSTELQGKMFNILKMKP